MNQRFRPPTHSSNQPIESDPGPVNVAVNPHASPFREIDERDLADRVTVGDPVGGPPPEGAISANEGDSANLTLPPLEALAARQEMMQQNRLGKPSQRAVPNPAELALLEYNNAKQALRDEYGQKRFNSPPVQERYDRAQENMVRLGLLRG